MSNSATLVVVLAAVNLLATTIVFYRLRQPTSFGLWLIKVYVSAVTPLLFLLGLSALVFGIISKSIPVAVLGGGSALLYLIHIALVTRASHPASGFEQAYGQDWEKHIPMKRKGTFLSRRYPIKLPGTKTPMVNRDMVFHTISSSHRQLVCDIWQPSEEIDRSGLAFIYLHGSAWTLWDKDAGTKTFFKHLTNQGHIIMDVAYRLFPETDMMGMVHDAKHAIAWMKANARAYGVDHEKIVIGGGSAGGHIALLTAYTNQHELFTPNELEHLDLSVAGVISLYGPTDLVSTYYHTCQHLVTQSELKLKKNGKSDDMPNWIQKLFGDYHRLGLDKDAEPGMLVPILGGSPDEKPHRYALFSPITYVNENCPETLLLQGEHDILVSIKAIRELYGKLKEVGVPTIMHAFPLTDHAFDIILTRISTAAHNAFYDIERFLAILAIEEKLHHKQQKPVSISP